MSTKIAGRIFIVFLLCVVSGLHRAAFCAPPSLPTSPTSSFAPDASAGAFDSQSAIHVTDHFVLIHSDNSDWAPRTGKLLEGVYAGFFRAFQHAGLPTTPPAGRLIWICFGNRSDFEDYASKSDRMGASTLDAYYSSRTNRVILLDEIATAPRSRCDDPVPARPALERTIHEAAHQLAFNSGVMRRGVMYPFWLSEGMATNFECSSLDELSLCGPNPPREKDLLRSRDDEDLLPLSTFLTLTRMPSSDEHCANRTYAQAWSVFRFAFQNHKDGLVRYLSTLSETLPGLRDEATLRREFTDAFGPIEVFEKEWLASLKTAKVTQEIASQE